MVYGALLAFVGLLVWLLFRIAVGGMERAFHPHLRH